MLKVLLQKQLTEIFRSYFYDAKKNRARSKGAIAAYLLLFALLMVGLLGGMFAMLSYTLCGALTAAGVDWMYFAIMGLLAIFLGVFGSVFNTYAGLYLAKDNDLLLSMPIPVRTIMAARLLGVYLMGLLYSGIVIIPAAIVYWIVAGVSLRVVCGSILLVLLISVFVQSLSCGLGWVVAKISQKLKHKSFLTVLIALAFLGGYYFFYYKAQVLLQNLLVNAAAYGERLRGAAYGVYLFGRVGVGDWRAVAVIAVVVLALFALLWWLLARSFLHIATASGTERQRVRRNAAVRVHGVGRALLAKEFGRFTASANYMLNCGLGTLLLVAYGVVLLWKGDTIQALLATLPVAPETGAVILSLAACMVAEMNDMAAPSVSLEGRSLWLVQSLPVTPWQVLRAKLWVQLLLTVLPALFSAVCICLIVPGSLLQHLMVLVAVLLNVVLLALFDLWIGLRLPNLTWTNEITPIKQGVGVLLALFGGMLYGLLPLVGYFLLGNALGAVGYLGTYAVLTLLLAAVLYLWLRKRGCARFAAL